MLKTLLQYARSPQFWTALAVVATTLQFDAVGAFLGINAEGLAQLAVVLFSLFGFGASAYLYRVHKTSVLRLENHLLRKNVSPQTVDQILDDLAA
jgi:hypothetical protein